MTARLEALRVQLHLPRPGFTLDVDLTLPGTGTTVLFGPSGSGKTTLLRCVAGLERAPRGIVALGDTVWQQEGGDTPAVWRPTWQRPVGMVFQEASLFDHLDVLGNLRYGLQRVKHPGGQQVLEHAISLMGLAPLLKRRTQQLSGGERQRVAMARALATQPRCLLMDEPLSALDAARKQEILPWLERLKADWRLPLLYVTHSHDELARLADHVVVLDQGRARTQGPIEAVSGALDSPLLLADEGGAVLHARVLRQDAPWHLAQVEVVRVLGLPDAATAAPPPQLWIRDPGLAPGTMLRVRIAARDVSLALSPPQGSSIQNILPGVIDQIAPASHPSQCLVRVRLGASAQAPALLALLTAKAAHQLQLQAGQPVWAQVKSVALVR